MIGSPTRQRGRAWIARFPRLCVGLPLPCLRFGLVCLLVVQGSLLAAEKPSRDREFLCRYADSPVKIDGQADEDAWKSAEIVDHFYQPWKKDAPKARTATKARMLWDRDNLYFFAEMEDADLYADVKEH